MSILGDLLNAQRRPSEEARRVTTEVGAVLNHALSDLDMSGSAALAAAEAALQKVNYQITDERAPRPQPGSGHLAAFGDDTEEDETPSIRDVDPAEFPDVRNDPRFLPPSGLLSDGDLDLDEDDDPDFRLPDAISGGEDEPTRGEEYDSVETAADDRSESQEGEKAGEDADGDAVTRPTLRVPDGPPSPTDRYADAPAPSVWGDEEECIPFGNRVADVAAIHAEQSSEERPRPTPSPRATVPPVSMPEPRADEQPSLPQRLQESVTATLGKLRDSRPRSRWLALGAVAALIVVPAGVLSLSGGRGKPPEPAGVTAAPPSATQTDAPAAGRETSQLVPLSVSSSCGGDTDPVGPFSRDKSRAWVCTRVRGLDGSVLNITFGKPVVITEITIVPGFNYVASDGRDEWNRHRLVSGVTWRMGGQVIPQQINPTRTGVTMKFPSVITSEMSMTITSSVRPPAAGASAGQIGVEGQSNTSDEADATTAVSSIVITGYPVDPAS